MPAEHRTVCGLSRFHAGCGNGHGDGGIEPKVNSTMRYQGRITEWNDERGFGFITPDGEGDPVFVHVKAFPRFSGRPTLWHSVNYSIGTDQRGRARASSVEFITRRRESVGRRRANQALLLLSASFAVFVGVSVTLGSLPLIVGGLYLSPGSA